MSKHFFDSPERDFASEAELLSGASALPSLPSRLRERVLTAATSAYRQARRWAEARQAASFLSVSLLASFVMSPLANSSLADTAWSRLAQISAASRELASIDDRATSPHPHSAWTLRHDREFLDLPQPRPWNPPAADLNAPSPRVARTESAPQRDSLMATLHSSDGWATVQAFQAVRSRSHATLQGAFAAN